METAQEKIKRPVADKERFIGDSEPGLAQRVQERPKKKRRSGAGRRRRSTTVLELCRTEGRGRISPVTARGQTRSRPTTAIAAGRSRQQRRPGRSTGTGSGPAWRSTSRTAPSSPSPGTTRRRRGARVPWPRPWRQPRARPRPRQSLNPKLWQRQQRPAATSRRAKIKGFPAGRRHPPRRYALSCLGERHQSAIIVIAGRRGRTCKGERFCGRACEHADWKGHHKTLCKASKERCRDFGWHQGLGIRRVIRLRFLPRRTRASSPLTAGP